MKMMKQVKMMLILVLVIVSGCTNQGYNTIKTGPDTYTLMGSDPNVLQGNAYKTCKDDGFTGFTTVESHANSLHVKCEKDEPSLITRAGEVWDGMKKRVVEFRQSAASKTEDNK